MSPGELITPELARYITELSHETNRQIGVIINRKGAIVATIIGDEREIVIPVLSDYPLGRKALRGVRCVHTHLKNEPLSEDDLTDLALLRLDVMAAIGVGPTGLPDTLYTAHLLPLGAGGDDTTGTGNKLYEVSGPEKFQRFTLDLGEFTRSLETEMGRAVTRDVNDTRERAVLVSVVTGTRKASPSSNIMEEQKESLAELTSLAETGNIVVVHTLSQRPKKINPRYLLGTGKIKELIISALQNEATLLIFDRELTPTQIRELGLITELKVIDRTQLILDIFANRAHSRDGKVQVELAQLRYMLPKLTGKGTSMSRLMGGIGARGPGESKLEMDRRKIGKRISYLENQLKTLTKGRVERRSKRAKSGVPIISIVGYTNAGKSTLLNTLTKSDTLVEDKLFATLDTATRRLRFPRERDTVITDTVGFIKDLPKELKKVFMATLEEMKDADLLLHLVDANDPLLEKHIKTVEELLGEIGLDEIPRILVFNKSDLLKQGVAGNLANRYGALDVSAKDPETLDQLLKRLEHMLWPGQDAESLKPSSQATSP